MNCYRITFVDGYQMLVDANTEQEAKNYAADDEARAQPYSAVRGEPNKHKIRSVIQLDD